jgi:hypothetical protein
MGLFQGHWHKGFTCIMGGHMTQADMMTFTALKTRSSPGAVLAGLSLINRLHFRLKPFNSVACCAVSILFSLLTSLNPCYQKIIGMRI